MRRAAITLATGKVVEDHLCEVEYQEDITVFLGADCVKTTIPTYTLYIGTGKFDFCQEGRDFRFLPVQRKAKSCRT